MIYRFFFAIYKILIGVIIRDYQDKGYGNIIKARAYYTYKPYSDYTIYKCYRSTNASKYWYEVLLHTDGIYYKINTDAYENGGHVVQTSF